MNASTVHYNADGFEPQAEEIITSRRNALHAFGSKLLSDLGRLPSQSLITDEALRHALYDIVNTVQEQRYVRPSERALSERSFFPLAHELHLPSKIRRQYLQRFWKVGMFHSSLGRPTGNRIRDREAFARVEDRLTAILDSSAHETIWYEQFLAQNICRDKDAAERIARVLDNVDDVAASQALDIMRAWCVYGEVGLLTASTYPYIDELLRIEQHRTTLSMAPERIAGLIALLRADVVAVLQTLDGKNISSLPIKTHSFHNRIADQSLLHQPANARARQKFRERLEPLRADYITALALNRDCDEVEAAMLLDATFNAGLVGIVDWRASSQATSVVDTFEWQRIKRMVVPFVEWLPTQTQTLVLDRLRACFDADAACSTGLSFRRLIEDMPSSHYRRRLQKQRLPKLFFETFADSSGIPREDIYGLFRTFVIYGLLGLVEQVEWERIVHPQLWHYLWMFKLGRVEDTVSIALLAERVNMYAQELDAMRLPRQAVSALFTHFSKDAYYNSGDGLATAGVPLRRALKLRGVNRLHENWLVIPVDLGIQLIDPALRPLSDRCTAVMVFDTGSSCPVDFWLTDTEADNTAISLAIYCALFHPLASTWPLRGLPEHIHVANCVDEQGALHRAVTYLMTDVIQVSNLAKELKVRRAINQIIQELQKHYAPPVLPGRRRGPKPHYTITEAERDIRKWLYNHCFPDHRVKDAPPVLRKHGVVLPGFDTPAAGWLLPVIGMAITIRDGIQLGNLVYSDPEVGIEPGIEVKVRSTPSRLGRARGVFIERESGPLHYLPLVPRG